MADIIKSLKKEIDKIGVLPYPSEMDIEIPNLVLDKMFDKMIPYLEDDCKILLYNKRTEIFNLIVKMLQHGITLDKINDMLYYDLEYGSSDYTPLIFRKFDMKVKRVQGAKMKNINIKVANHPYQDSSNKAKNNKMWHKLTMQDLNDSCDGTMALEVTPDSIFNGNVGIGKKFRQRFTTDWDLLEVDFTTNKHFNVGVDICSWQAVKQPYAGSTKVIYRDGSEEYIDFRKVKSINSMPRTYSQSIEQSIIEQMWNFAEHFKSSLGTVVKRSSLSKQQCNFYKNKIYYSGTNKPLWTSENSNNAGQLKLVLPFSCDPYSAGGFSIMSDEVGMLNCWLPISNNSEGELIKSLLQTKPYRILIKDRLKVFKTSGFSPAIKNSRLPKVPFKIGMTDADVCDLLGFNQQQKNFVLNWSDNKNAKK